MRFLTALTLTALIYSCKNPKQDTGISNTPSHESEKVAMTDTTKNDILQEINISIKSGFYNKEDILANMEDYLYEIPYDQKWVKEQIENAYSTRLKEQKAWPTVTDFDKLAQAFDILNKSGIIALHNAGYTKQDGEGDSEEIHDELLKKGIKIKGYCYYHWQDIERVVDDRHLYIGFGDFNANDKDALEIGKEVAATLEKQGFKINWDKTVVKRIEITNINWQKRFGNDNCSNEKAIKLLSSYAR